jgi:hypothetical protein
MIMFLISIGAFGQAATAVRQTHQLYPHSDPSSPNKCPAALSRRLVAVLNDQFRVVDDGIQWMLDRRKGRPTPKSTGWRACGSYVRTRELLLKGIEGSEIAPRVLSILQGLPEKHPSLTRNGFERRKRKRSAP